MPSVRVPSVRVPSVRVPSVWALAVWALVVWALPATWAMAQNGFGPAPPPTGQAINPEEKFLFQYQFKKGEIVRWDVEHRVHLETTVNGTTQRASTLSKSIKRWDVLETFPSGDFVINHSVESVDMWQEMSGRARVSYNSLKDKDAPSGFENVLSSLGNPLTHLKRAPNAELLDRKVLYAKAGTAQADPGQQIIPLMPREAAPLGATWVLPFQMQLKLENNAVKLVKLREQFQLKQVLNNRALLTVETQILTPIQDPALESQLIQRAGRGEVQFDGNLGRVSSIQIDVDKVVVGFRGLGSSLRYTSRFAERLMPPTVGGPTPEKTSNDPAPANAGPTGTVPQVSQNPRPTVPAPPPLVPAEGTGPRPVPEATLNPPGTPTNTLGGPPVSSRRTSPAPAPQLTAPETLEKK